MRVDNLPPGARTWMAMGSENGWTVEAQLLAGAVDVLKGANWQRAGGKGSKPKPIDRPKDLIRQAEAAERHAQRAARFLARKRSQRGR